MHELPAGLMAKQYPNYWASRNMRSTRPSSSSSFSPLMKNRRSTVDIQAASRERQASLLRTSLTHFKQQKSSPKKAPILRSNQIMGMNGHERPKTRQLPPNNPESRQKILRSSQGSRSCASFFPLPKTDISAAPVKSSNPSSSSSSLFLTAPPEDYAERSGPLETLVTQLNALELTSSGTIATLEQVLAKAKTGNRPSDRALCALVVHQLGKCWKVRKEWIKVSEGRHLFRNIQVYSYLHQHVFIYSEIFSYTQLYSYSYIHIIFISSYSQIHIFKTIQKY